MNLKIKIHASQHEPVTESKEKGTLKTYKSQARMVWMPTIKKERGEIFVNGGDEMTEYLTHWMGEEQVMAQGALGFELISFIKIHQFPQ